MHTSRPNQNYDSNVSQLNLRMNPSGTSQKMFSTTKDFVSACASVRSSLTNPMMVVSNPYPQAPQRSSMQPPATSGVDMTTPTMSVKFKDGSKSGSGGLNDNSVFTPRTKNLRKRMSVQAFNQDLQSQSSLVAPQNTTTAAA